ncbi:ABC transporter substrate-binding protein [Thalassospira profundimaris]|uniref:ABC transporter substrate-binding protein n=1 Tax=Thalassospira profundimaris TaxID=502049 RepID=UPI000287431B|nr:ABC transporter substrate-binding protein [Thalassospira profundimaris]EKF08231.1 iron-chelate uptake ABC transporter, FeCT family, periplasmic iron-chelate-binding protein, putative [Thalassospira profundimaris WP0211]
MRKLSQMLVFMVLVLIGPMPAQAETITVTDIAGREVAVNVPIKRAILGEGRQLYIIAALDRENPAARIVGWRKDLIEADPATYQAYLAKFPEFADIPAFEGLEQSLIDIETTIAQKPDIVFLNLETKRAVEEAAYIEKLGALDIPVVYVDFRNSPEVNTEPSIRLFGKLFGKQERAEEFIAFRAEEIAKITDRLASVKPERPQVFIDRAAGFYEDCCHSFGDGNFGAMVEMAGGDNIAKDLIPGTFGQINAEQVIVSDPDHIIVTSAMWDVYVPGGKWVPVGPGADPDEIVEKLKFYPTRPAYLGIKAQKTKAFHAVWHQFYNSPYQFVAIQQMAKWFHPELFADIDPDETFKQLHDRFLPIDYQPGYFGTLSN